MRALTFLLAAALADATAAETLTWQQANKESAASLARQDFKQGADLARKAFELYGDKKSGYDVTVHAQLLLNAIDATLKDDGPLAALKELKRGTGAISDRSGKPQPVLIAIYEEGVAIARHADLPREVEARWVDTCYGRAVYLAERAFGDTDPRAIALHVRWAMERPSDYTGPRKKLQHARGRAVDGQHGAAFIAMIDVALARHEMVAGRWEHAIRGYQDVIKGIEERKDPSERTLLQAAYAHLLHVYERVSNEEAAATLRQKLIETFGYDGTLVPLLRVTPEFPAQTPGGFVVLELTISETGSVRDARVLEFTHEKLAAAALKVIPQWTFRPLIVDGKAVEQKGLQRFNFRR